MLGRNNQRIAYLEKQVELLKILIDDLLTAFNEFSEAASKDLGYEVDWRQSVQYTCIRRLGYTAPEAPQIIRHKTARCRGKERK